MKASSKIVAFFLVLAVSTADAAFMMKITNGSDTRTVTDGGAGDLSPVDGDIAFVGILGGVPVSINSGSSKPLVGTAERPILELTVNITGNAATGLLISMTDTDFGPSVDPIDFNLDINGSNSASNTGVVNSVSAYVDTGNTAFGTSQLVGSVAGPLSGSFTGGDVGDAVGTGGSYSATVVVDLSLPNGLSSTSFDASLAALPEPATYAIWLGFAVFGITGHEVAKRRRSQKTA